MDCPLDEAADVVLNPRAKLTLVRRQGAVVAVTVKAPVRGRPLKAITFARVNEPALVDFLERLAAIAGAVEADLDDASWARLRDAGLFVAESAVPRPVRFRCDPGDPPRDLVPLASAVPRAVTRARTAQLRVSEGLRSPAALRGGPFDEGLAWIEVDHPDTPLPTALSIGEADRALVERLSPGGAAPEGASADRISAWAAADILVDPACVEVRRAEWAAARADAKARLSRDRYAVVRGLVHPIQLAALRRYYRELVAEGYVPLGDGQVALRYYAHNEPLAVVLHRRLTGLVSELAGEAMKPSYVFFASYRPFAVLAPHRDREPCELSISLLVDSSPEPAGRSPWPLYIEAGGGAAPIDLGLGDGLLYRGRELTHFRDALPDGHTSTSLFFHYVAESFAGNLD